MGGLYSFGFKRKQGTKTRGWAHHSRPLDVDVQKEICGATRKNPGIFAAAAAAAAVKGNTAAQTHGPLRSPLPTRERGSRSMEAATSLSTRTDQSSAKPGPLREGEGSESRAARANAPVETRANSCRKDQGSRRREDSPPPGRELGLPPRWSPEPQIMPLSTQSWPRRERQSKRKQRGAKP